MTKLLLFDVDGTLVLTGGAGLRAMNRAFEKMFGVGNGLEGINFAGRTDRIILRDALALHNVQPTRSHLDEFREIYLGLLREEVEMDGPRKKVLPGIRPLLEALAPRQDMRLALLTGNFAEAARIKLEHFDLWRYFLCGAYADDAIERNDLVPIALERMAACGGPPIPAERTIVIGDTPLDVACAHVAGARVLAVATGGYDVAELTDAGADAVLEDLSDTRRVVELLERGV